MNQVDESPAAARRAAEGQYRQLGVDADELRAAGYDRLAAAHATAAEAFARLAAALADVNDRTNDDRKLDEPQEPLP